MSKHFEIISDYIIVDNNLQLFDMKERIVRCDNCKKAETVNCPMYRAHFGYTDYDYCSCGDAKE